MGKIFSEKFLGYKMNQRGRYGDPVGINTEDELSAFLIDNVEKYHELRVTDGNDYLVFHVMEQVLLYPLSVGMDANNKWDSAKKRFVPKV